MRPTAEKIYGMRVSDMGVGPLTEQRIALLCFGKRPDDAVAFAEFRSRLTVGQAIECFKEHHVIAREFQQFSTRVVELGLTRADWYELPPTTVTPEVLRELPREEFLALHAGILGLRRTTLESLSRAFRESGGAVTVKRLLEFDVEEGTRLKQTLASFNLGIESARKLLRQVLSPEEIAEYPFMTYGDRVPAIAAFADKHDIPYRTAKLVLEIAHKEGWTTAPSA